MAAGFLTPELARKAQAIIDRHVQAAIGVVYGQDVATSEGWKLALSLGMVEKDAKGSDLNRQMFTFGLFLAHVEEATSRPAHYGTTPAEFLAAVEADAIPRVREERHAAEHARVRAAHYCAGLGNKAGATIGSSLIEADARLRREMQGYINDATAARYGDEAAAQRMARRAKQQGKDPSFYSGAFRSEIDRLRSDLGHLSNDWSRDWTRIAQTESSRAQQEGQRAGWEAQEAKRAKDEERPPRRLLAYKMPRPDACKHCRRLHLDGGVPRIFHLDELIANGDNVGRRAASWLPGVGPVHPYCGCSLHRLSHLIQMPKGWTSGRAAPSVIGADGMLVLPEE